MNTSNKNTRIITFAIGNVRTVIDNGSNQLVDAHNMSIVYGIEEYIKVGDVITFDVVKKGRKASEAYYSAIKTLEDKYNVKSDFINGSYMALIESPILKAS